MSSGVWLDGEGISIGGVPLVTDDGPAAIVSGTSIGSPFDAGPESFVSEDLARRGEIRRRQQADRIARRAKKPNSA